MLTAQLQDIVRIFGPVMTSFDNVRKGMQRYADGKSNASTIETFTTIIGTFLYYSCHKQEPSKFDL